uniref:NADH dehydrogenase subunit 4L n=1 Tax=Gymnopraia lapislazula TaxID=316224 RepID=UPI0026E1C6D9|nr:NADH dehydrogenase subunit 4L [Gymnopraia lapislazula]WJJ70121.1 NADH dehydrogenase subunit 4L [Gymnopraia lapislazula]
MYNIILFYILILIGIFGVLINIKNLFLILLFMEIIYSGIIILCFFAFNINYSNNIIIISFYIMICLAVETCIGLCLVVNIFKTTGTSELNINMLLKG